MLALGCHWRNERSRGERDPSKSRRHSFNPQVLNNGEQLPMGANGKPIHPSQLAGSGPSNNSSGAGLSAGSHGTNNWLAVDQHMAAKEVQRRRNSAQPPSTRSISCIEPPSAEANYAISQPPGSQGAQCAPIQDSAQHQPRQQPSGNGCNLPKSATNAVKNGNGKPVPSQQHQQLSPSTSIPVQVPPMMSSKNPQNGGSPPITAGEEANAKKKRSGSMGMFKFSRMPLIGKNVKMFDSKKGAATGNLSATGSSNNSAAPIAN